MDITSFLNKHLLSNEYGVLANKWYIPIIKEIIRVSLKHHRPIVVGVNGSQGSGKSTFSDLFCYVAEQKNKVKVVNLSIDDFYLTSSERQEMASSVHPLLRTRGVPGTHDVSLINDTLSRLKRHDSKVSIPRFDKSIDDRKPQSQWDLVDDEVDIILLEGWCVGSEAQDDADLIKPVNDLEREEDQDLSWRRYVNDCLGDEYQTLFSVVDVWIMMKIPSFHCVLDWRTEQENKLADVLKEKQSNNSSIMNAKEISQFIKHYQRITEHTLKTLPSKVHYLFELDSQRNVNKLSKPIKLRF